MPKRIGTYETEQLGSRMFRFEAEQEKNWTLHSGFRSCMVRTDNTRLPAPLRLLADIGNGFNGFSRAAVFWATVLPAVREYQKVNKWKEEQQEDDAAAQAEWKRQTEELHHTLRRVRAWCGG